MSEKQITAANTERLYKVTYQDLPLSCPMPDMKVWNSHPRVYLPIIDAENQEAVCPYCEAKFVLVADSNATPETADNVVDEHGYHQAG